MSDSISGESNSAGQLRRLRRDSRDDQSNVTLIGYEREGGEVVACTGDDNAIYVKVLGGATGLAANVMGSIAHDAPDDELTNYPVKVGGHATSAIRTAVSADGDIADLSVTLNGAARAQPSGPNGDVVIDDNTNIVGGDTVLGVHDPVIGQIDDASVTDPTADGTAISLLKGIIDTLQTGGGVASQIEGNVANDAADGTTFPVKVGGRANAAIAAAVSENDRVNGSYTLEGSARTQPSGPNGDVTIANVAFINENTAVNLATHDPSLGTASDSAVTDPTASASAISVLKGILTILDIGYTLNTALFQQLGTASSEVQISAAPGNIYALTCENRSGATRYVQFHDTAAALTTGVSVPKYTFPVYATSNIIVGNDFFIKGGGVFATGIRWAWSTTANVWTDATGADAANQTTQVHYYP